MVVSSRSYDVIVFGDEVPGVFAAVSAAREYRRRTNQYPRVLLMSKGNLQQGIGGHLVRGGLAYLDRTQIDKSLRDALGLEVFGDPPAIYKEFLQKASVKAVALDPLKGDAALRQMLRDAGVNYLSNIAIKSVVKQGQILVGITTFRGETFTAKQFIDATVNAELAQAAGVKKLKGYETFGLPESELAVTLVFETQGLTVRKLKEFDYRLLKRFTNRADTEAQKWLLTVSGNNPQLAQQLRNDMVDERGNLKTLWQGPDDIIIRSPALSIAYHSFRGIKHAFAETGVLLDKANIAILPGERLSWNALLFSSTGSEAEALARGGAKPTSRMLEEMNFIEKWFKSLGATAVNPASELYIRHAGNVANVVQPLSGSDMLTGGVEPSEALGTFAYHFDVRGGIKDIYKVANQNGLKSVNFEIPIYNIGFQHTLMKDVPNLAVVSPGSGFKGLASASGRIVEYNSGVGQGLGIAAILALLSNRRLANISNQEVRQVLIQTKKLPRIFGRPRYAEVARMNVLESSTSAIA